METIMHIKPIIKYWINGNKQSERWPHNLHMMSNPSFIEYYESGKVYRESWYLNNTFHRVDGPADIWYHESGVIKIENWYTNGLYHRVDGPAIIRYYESRIVEQEYWYIDGIRHREDGPADTWYYESGDIEQQCWYINNQLHRVDGPAIIWYSKLNKEKAEREYYHLNGKHLMNAEKEEYKKWLIDNLNKPYNTWTDEEKILWKLRWI